MVFVCRRLPANEKKNLCGLRVSVVKLLSKNSVRDKENLCGLCVSSEAGGELSSCYWNYERNFIFAVQGQRIPFFDVGSDQSAIDED